MSFKPLFAFFSILTSLGANAQQAPAVTEYINTYRQVAVEEQLRTGIPAAITLAQGIHESGAGKGDLALRSNNHFGIKCKNTWTGDKVYHDDDARGECFRAYTSVHESYKDHSDFLKNNGRYASLFLLDITDYKSWASGLKKAGYATNPRYSQIIIKLIEDNNLNDYTLAAIQNKDSLPLAATSTIFLQTSQQSKKEEPAITPTNESTTETLTSMWPEGIRSQAGPFRINGCKVIFAKEGQSLLALAKQYGMGLAQLLEYNDMSDQQVLDSDQPVYLHRKKRDGQTDYHIMGTYETLWSVSQTEGIRLDDLLQYNHLTAFDQPTAGTRLLLKSTLPKNTLRLGKLK